MRIGFFFTWIRIRLSRKKLYPDTVQPKKSDPDPDPAPKQTSVRNEKKNMFIVEASRHKILSYIPSATEPSYIEKSQLCDYNFDHDLTWLCLNRRAWHLPSPRPSAAPPLAEYRFSWTERGSRVSIVLRTGTTYLSSQSYPPQPQEKSIFPHQPSRTPKIKVVCKIYTPGCRNYFNIKKNHLFKYIFYKLKIAKIRNWINLMSPSFDLSKCNFLKILLRWTSLRKIISIILYKNWQYILGFPKKSSIKKS